MQKGNEPVATDTIFSDTPAINDGSSMAQFFVGMVCDTYGIKSQKQFINTFYDNIKSRGAKTTIIADGGKYEISKKVADLLRRKQYESEPYHQHQDKAEQHYGVVKSVGSHQVPFPMCTLETLQKYCSTSSLLITFC